MNPLIGFFFGTVTAVVAGLGVGFSLNAPLGFLSFYCVSLLVDIRYELERLNEK